MRKSPYHSIVACALAVYLASAVGCASTVYVVDLTPTEAGLRRTFTVDEVTGNNRSKTRASKTSDRERLIDAYGLDLGDDDPLPEKLSGVFVGRMPNDVGGFGSYHQLDSPFGVARFYTERFRGSLDLTDSLERRRRSLDDAITLINRWANHQWSRQDEGPDQGGGIANWVDTTLRNDLHNLLLVTWTHSAANEIVQGSGDLTKSITSSYFAYLGQYAAENDYLQWSEIPSLFHAMNTQNNEATRKIIHQVLVRKLQQSTGRNFRDELEIVLHPDQFKTSLQDFLKSTDEYAALVRQSQAIANQTSAEEVEVEPLDLITLPLSEAFVPSFIWAHDRVEVRLHLHGEPDHSNGTWDVDSQSVQWNRSLNSGPIPPLAFAVWTEPDVEFQRRFFGETKINGDQLAMHSTWFAGLNESESQRWRDALDTFTKRRKRESDRSAKDVFEIVAEEFNLADSPLLMKAAEQTKELL